MPFLRERSGRWSPVKIVAFVTALLPALWIAYQAAADDLGARPITEAIHQAGDWALRFLLITLAITPAQRIFHYPRVTLARRTLGVASAGYATLHFSLYVLDQHFDLLKVASEIVLRIYLTIGALGLAGLIALASTSTDAAISRLGSGRWHALHRFVYAIPVLAVVHFFIQSKTAIGEAMLYLFTSGVDARRVLLAHFDIEMEVRPAWWVLAAGLVAAAAGFWRQKRQRPSARRISPSALSGAIQVQSGS
ncbi:MAG: hypothetical protein AUI16_24820 [Alphaproteobacteria bacterium 13_2_20CM_2_64_7]|nr:MAG: hypothetical protein AUI16_24820 [Alphaproteobacteria bacterium 13_2_20CM_2_64_7]